MGMVKTNDIIVKSLPFHLQIYEILKKKIISGELQAGNRIFENKISQELGVSRSPVREALRILEQDELVIVTANGLMVNPMNQEDMEEVYQCRMAVEPFAAKLAASQLSNEELHELKELVTKARAHHQREEYNEVIEANTVFHDIIVRACGNSRLKAIVAKIHLLTILSRRTELQCYKRNEDYLLEHEKVLEALIMRNGTEAEKRLREHINNDFRFYQAQCRKISS
jgi:DNA-binding GntR family transcriptional regulator